MTSAYAYFDTSALMDWLESSAAQPTVKAKNTGPKVGNLLSKKGVLRSIGELAIIETLNAVHTAWRDTDPRKSSYNGDWARESQARLLEIVAAGNVLVRQYGPSDIEHALMLVTEMTETHGRNFRAWDALHLRMAVQWSREVGSPVQLITTNGDFSAFLELHPKFSRHVSLVDLR